MLLSDAIEQIRDILHEPTEAFWTDEKLIRWVNEGMRLFYSKKGIEDRWDIAVLKDDVEVGFDEDVIKYLDIQVLKVAYQKTGETTWEEIDDEDYSFFDNTIYLNDEISDDGKLMVFGYRMPTEISEDSEELEIPAGYETAIIEFVVFRAKQVDADPTRGEHFQIFSGLKLEWEKQTKRRNERKEIRIERGW